MEQLVLDLTNPQSRENALLELSKKRESFPDLAPYLWHSFGTISALLQVLCTPASSSLTDKMTGRGQWRNSSMISCRPTWEP
jgi:Cell differentiation family, Rcd1-like